MLISQKIKEGAAAALGLIPVSQPSMALGSFIAFASSGRLGKYRNLSLDSILF